MGIRIEAFAVDVAALGRLLDRPLWRILADLRHAPHGRDVLFSVYREEYKTRYVLRTVDHRVVKVRYGSGTHAILDEGQLAADDGLRQSTRDYLAGESSFDLAFLLRDLPSVDGVSISHELTSGYRPWWIGSLLGAAEGLWHETPPFAELAGYLSRILRGFNCGYPLKPYKRMPIAGDFPVLPVEDVDYPMAVLNNAECTRFIELLDSLMQCQPSFGRPPLDTATNDDTDWNEFVRRMVGPFLRIPQLSLPNVHLVSFIG